jgi:CheY-like chemotaxis protein
LRQLVAQLLRTAGYEVVEATDGKDGIRQYRHAPFDLVVTDLLMPEKDGLEVLIELRSTSPDLKIITISGANAYGNSPLNTSRLLGADRTIQKPFNDEQLLQAVREVLG